VDLSNGVTAIRVGDENMNNKRYQHILVVEDDRDIREALRAYLERHDLYVSVAADAASARSLLSSARVDFTAVSITAPGEAWSELCRDLRAAEDRPCVFLTTGDEPGRVAELGLGSAEGLTKPFNPRGLLVRIRAALPQRASGVGAIRTGE
jgi:two-component system OmpR family response regulator